MAHSALKLSAAWRPWAAALCVATLAFQGLGHPILTWVWAFMGRAPAAAPGYMPAEVFWAVMAMMATLAGVRSYDKLKGLAPPAPPPKA